MGYVDNANHPNLLMKKFYIQLLQYLVKMFNNLSKIINKYLNYIENDLKLKILTIEFNKSGRFLSFYLNNEYLYKGTDVLQAIFNALMNNERFLEFGSRKIIIINAITSEANFNFHHNILITNHTSFIEYYNKVKDIIQENYKPECEAEGYPVDVIPNFEVRVWNLDNPLNINIKNNSLKDIKKQPSSSRGYHTNNITPLKKDDISKQLKYLSTMDIETMDWNGKQIPISISTSYSVNKSKLFLINKDLLLIDCDKAINDLWITYFKFLKLNHEFISNIFVQNLGSFDGYFLYHGGIGGVRASSAKHEAEVVASPSVCNTILF